VSLPRAVSSGFGASVEAPLRERGALHLRRYGRDSHIHHHDHVQVVVPVLGTLDMEVGGRGGRIDLRRAVVIAPGTDHDQTTPDDNRFLIVDLDVAALGEVRVEQLQRRPFVATTPRMLALARFVDRRCDGTEDVPGALAAHCLPPLLQALGSDPAPLRRLQLLCDAMGAAPGEAWTVARMAAQAGLGESRLHALFRSTFDQSPQQWLTALRLQRACRQLAETSIPIARLAVESGWSDQTALTRAMKRATGCTPAAWRRERSLQR
jgi:AraC-like DNA-binding protein